MGSSESRETQTHKLIEVHDLKTYFYLDQGVVRAVDGVSFDIHRGETLGLVGESGCGKTVTSRSIMRLIEPPARIVSGRVLLHLRPDHDGGADDVIDLTALDPDGRQIRSIRGREIAMVFQEPMTSLSLVHTVGDQVMEALLLHGTSSRQEAQRLTIEMLARVRMSQPTRVIGQYPFQLSGGMRQRVMIAMALVCRPSLLIADEPTTALDVTTAAQILNVMRNLQSELGMAILYITHNLGVIAQMAQRVAVMYLGQIVEIGGVRDLFNEPQHPYTQALLRSIPRLGKRSHQPLESIKGTLPDPYTTPRGCRFHARCSRMIPGLCDVEESRVYQIKPGHEVRCHLYARHADAGQAGR